MSGFWKRSTVLLVLMASIVASALVWDNTTVQASKMDDLIPRLPSDIKNKLLRYRYYFDTRTGRFSYNEQVWWNYVDIRREGGRDKIWYTAVSYWKDCDRVNTNRRLYLYRVDDSGSVTLVDWIPLRDFEDRIIHYDRSSDPRPCALIEHQGRWRTNGWSIDLEPGVYLLYSPLNTSRGLRDDNYAVLEVFQSGVELSVEVQNGVAVKGQPFRFHAVTSGWPEEVTFYVTVNNRQLAIEANKIRAIDGEREEWEAIWQVPADVPSGRYAAKVSVVYGRGTQRIEQDFSITVTDAFQGVCRAIGQFVWAYPGDRAFVGCIDETEGGRIVSGKAILNGHEFSLDDVDGDRTWSGYVIAPQNDGMYEVVLELTAESVSGAQSQVTGRQMLIVVGPSGGVPGYGTDAPGIEVVDVDENDGFFGGSRGRSRLVR